MDIQSTRFGEISIDRNSIIMFPGGLPGLEKLSQYAIVRCDQTDPIQWLQSIEDADISIPIVNPFVLKPDYEIVVDDEELDLIETHEEEDLVVLNIMVLPEELTKMTINLMAPLLINMKKMIGVQIMMDHKAYSLQHPVYDALLAYYQNGEVDADASANEKAE